MKRSPFIRSWQHLYNRPQTYIQGRDILGGIRSAADKLGAILTKGDER
jgi:hypothetical protein